MFHLKICYKIVNCALDSVDVYQLEQHGRFVIEWQPDCTETICEIWSMISGTFFNFLFVIVGNVEASAAARFLSRFAVRGLLASAKAVIVLNPWYHGLKTMP